MRRDGDNANGDNANGDNANGDNANGDNANGPAPEGRPVTKTSQGQGLRRARDHTARRSRAPVSLEG